MAGNFKSGKEPSGSIKFRNLIDGEPVSVPRRTLLHGVSISP